MSARAAGLVLLALLAACDPIRTEPARYACSRALPAETQCLGGWRCGADGLCFDPSGQGALPGRCDDPATDCPTGWKCSLTQQCFDPGADAGLALPCRDPAVHCPTAWKCGLDQRCLDPNQAGPWRCEDTARDCTGGWTCGASGLCFDRADAGRVSCREGVATDCNEAWRCGIDGLCQQRDAGAPWPCLDDTHCEAAWRCGPAGRCVDSTTEGLRPNEGSPVGERFTLQRPPGRPDDLALSAPAVSRRTETAFLSGAVRFGQRLEVFAINARAAVTASNPDAGVPVLTGTLDLGAEPVSQLAQAGLTTFLRVDGGVRLVRLRGPGQVQPVGNVSGNFDRLHASAERQCVVAMNATTAWCITERGDVTVWASASFVAVDGGVARILDAVEWENAAGQSVLFAATTQGLFARDVHPQNGPTGPWVHVAWGGSVVRVEELRQAPQLSGPPLLQAVVREDDSPETQVWTFAVRRQATPSDGGVSSWPGNYGPVFTRPVPSASARYDVSWGDGYASCGNGARGWLAAPPAVNSATGVGVVQALLRCATDDGGVALTRLSTGSFGTSAETIPQAAETTPLTRSALWTTNDDRSVAMADEEGRLFLASSLGDQLLLQPWTLPSAPETVSGQLATWVMARTPAEALRLGQTTVVATIEEGHFIGTVGTGVGPVMTDLEADNRYLHVTGVEGDAALSVYDFTGPTVRFTALLEPEREGPLAYGRPRDRPLPDGGFEANTVPLYAMGPPAVAGMRASIARGGVDRLWFLTKGDQLLVAPIGAPVPVLFFDRLTPTLPTAGLAVTPLPGAPLTHVLGLPADPTTEASYGQALVVAAGRFFHVRADNPVVWRVTEPLDTASEVIESWADGARVRVGDRTGQVRSYPTRVVIGPPLGAGKSAWDFVDVCGVTYALSTDGLFRLAATTASPVGTWTRVMLPTMSFGTGGRLHTDGAGLLVFDDVGRVANVTALSCAQPL